LVVYGSQTTLWYLETPQENGNNQPSCICVVDAIKKVMRTLAPLTGSRISIHLLSNANRLPPDSGGFRFVQKIC